MKKTEKIMAVLLTALLVTLLLMGATCAVTVYAGNMQIQQIQHYDFCEFVGVVRGVDDFPVFPDTLDNGENEDGSELENETVEEESVEAVEEESVKESMVDTEEESVAPFVIDTENNPEDETEVPVATETDIGTLDIYIKEATGDMEEQEPAEETNMGEDQSK